MKATETKSTKEISSYNIELDGDEVAEAVAMYIKRRKGVAVDPDKVKFHADSDCVYSASVYYQKENEVVHGTADL